MNKIEFLVKGSTEEPYKVFFEKDEENLKSSCNCKAAISGKHCKHRLNILNGEQTNIVSNNSQDVNTVVEWLKNTNLEQALESFYMAEKNAEKAKKQLAKAKKDLVKAMK